VYLIGYVLKLKLVKLLIIVIMSDIPVTKVTYDLCK